MLLVEIRLSFFLYKLFSCALLEHMLNNRWSMVCTQRPYRAVLKTIMFPYLSVYGRNPPIPYCAYVVVCVARISVSSFSLLVTAGFPISTPDSVKNFAVKRPSDSILLILAKISLLLRSSSVHSLCSTLVETARSYNADHKNMFIFLV